MKLSQRNISQMVAKSTHLHFLMYKEIWEQGLFIAVFPEIAKNQKQPIYLSAGTG